MLIDNQEALKIWLTSHLEPLCDADPAALAKYVIALIKKDKAMSDLKDSMMQQLDVFLQSETQSFVDILFKAIDSKEYVTPSVETTTENAEEIPKPKEEKPEDEEDKKEEERTLPPDSTTPIREPSPRSKEEPKRKSGGHSPPPPDDRMPRRFGRSSPPPPLHGGNMADRLGPIRPRRHDNRPNRSPPRRFRSRSPSPRHDRFRPVRRRTRSPPRFRGRSFSRSPARHRPRGASLSPPTRTSRDSTPTKDEGAGGYTPSAKRPRCRDYDEKGFCLRGDLCKFDHGNDAVVLEDNAKPGVPGYQPGAPPAPGTEPYVPGLPHPAGINFPPPVNMSVPPPGYPPSYLGKRPHDGGGYVPPAKRFDFNRLGGRGRGRGRGRGGASSMLAVRNIPPELNTITHLNGHFVRYGTLVNVQVRFEGDPASALVTFQGPNEAELAFNTAEAVMNNRFIKVYWHMDKTKGTVKERLGNPNEDPLVLMHGDRVTKTLVNKKEGETSPPGEAGENGETQKEEKERAILAIQRNQEMLQTKADLVKVRVDFLDLSMKPMIHGMCDPSNSLRISSNDRHAYIPLDNFCGTVAQDVKDPLRTDIPHIYVHVDDDLALDRPSFQVPNHHQKSVTFRFKVTDYLTRWNLRISQIQCDGANLQASQGCSQFYNQNKGNITSFNLADQSYPNSMDMSVCILRDPSACAIHYKLKSFGVGPTKGSRDGKQSMGYGLICHDYVVFNGEKTCICGGINNVKDIILPVRGPQGFTVRSDASHIPQADVGYHIEYEYLHNCTGTVFYKYPSTGKN